MSSRAAGAPLSVSMSAGRPQTSRPFVCRDVPWPTVKPRLPAGSRSQFSSDDLPDRCGPHMATTQSSASIDAITSAVSGTSRSFLSPASSTTTSMSGSGASGKSVVASKSGSTSAASTASA